MSNRARAGYGLPSSLDEVTMSATAKATQERLAKTTSWLAQLRGNAEWAGLTVEDAAQKAQERFGKPLDELTVTEAQTLAWEYSDISKQKAEAARAARTPKNGLHSHPCFQCHGLATCNRPDCRETVSEHRYCHEGQSKSEWANYYRKYGDGWQMS